MPAFLRLLLVLAVVGVLVPPARAAELRDPYLAEVPVAGEEAAQRNEALGRALREVAVRVSGDPRAAGRVRQVKDPSSLVSQYQFVPAPDGVGRLLRVEFDRAAMDALLRDSGIASREEALRSMPAEVSASQQPPPLTGSAERVRVQVRGVESLATYARVLRQFQGLPCVERVTVRGARGDALLLDVDARGGSSALDQGVRSGDTLVPEAAPGSGAWPGGVRLSYRARP
jgi:hypothetical protein